jgi:hypothetical protein
MDLAIPWRRTAIVASALAAAELVALLALGGLVLGRSLAHQTPAQANAAAAAGTRPGPQTRSQLPVAPHVARLPRSRTHVLVLNGNGRQGAAGDEAQTLRTLGYKIGGTRNAARMDYPTTIVLYRPGYHPEARRLAHDSGIRAVRPLDGLRPAQLRGSQLAVIVGNS